MTSAEVQYPDFLRQSGRAVTSFLRIIGRMALTSFPFGWMGSQGRDSRARVRPNQPVSLSRSAQQGDAS
jgi:hypothetical protein